MAVSRIDEAGLNVNQYGNRNIIINGKFEIDQRHSFASHTVSSGSDFFADRWGFYTDAGAFAQYGATSQVVSDGPTGFEKSVKWTTTSSGTIPATGEVLFRQKIEGYNINQVDYGSSNAKNLTLSFYVKSSIAGDYGFTCWFADSGGTNRYNLRSYTVNSANTWEYKTISIPANTANVMGRKTNLDGMNLNWDLGEGTDYSGSVTGNWQTTYVNGLTGGVKIADNNGATWQITGVQLEVGDTATDFEHRTFGDEEQKCQRYYYRMKPINPSGGVAHAGAFNHHARSSTQLYGVVHLLTAMRTTPSIAISSTSDMNAYHGSTTLTVSSFTINGMSTAASAEINVTVSSGGSAGTAGWLRINKATGYIEFNSEL